MSNKKSLPWATIRLFAMDVDGVLTDGTVQISSDGTEAKNFSILDGMGLKRLEKSGRRRRVDQRTRVGGDDHPRE